MNRRSLIKALAVIPAWLMFGKSPASAIERPNSTKGHLDFGTVSSIPGQEEYRLNPFKWSCAVEEFNLNNQAFTVIAKLDEFHNFESFWKRDPETLFYFQLNKKEKSKTSISTFVIGYKCLFTRLQGDGTIYMRFVKPGTY